MVWTVVQGFGVAAMVTFVAMKVLGPFAHQIGLVDRPGGRKRHDQPTPLTGGLAMLAGFLGALVFIPHVSPLLLPFGAGCAMLVAIGCIDDRYDVRWWVRLLAQCAAVVVMIFGAGIYLKTLGPIFGSWPLMLGWMAVPFTVFAAVGVINAMNMTDGSDGLAGSLALSSLALFAGAALYAGHTNLVMHILPLMGALAAFLLFNLRMPWQQRARAFMGDAGSMLLGFTIAWVAIHLTQTPRHPVPPALAPWLVAIPILDCVAVSLRRIIQGRSPFSADRGHLHHCMADAGFTPTQVAVTLSLATLLIGALAAVSLKLGMPRIGLVWLFVVLGLAYVWFTARKERVVALFRRLHGPAAEAKGAPVMETPRG
jgi:UDP-GlcNAc:undecaprenyl-phosphate/decaprenyl-phosphate GlcNAc-1-phosphate transferase